ncbi:unnamed protein product [Linum trigynum]|uniref:Uncharacterized protein n=1 Tax=Linum trigynum TaxID=586398 RepID=A0AAV2D4M5_9ROSI
MITQISNASVHITTVISHVAGAQSSPTSSLSSQSTIKVAVVVDRPSPPRSRIPDSRFHHCHPPSCRCRSSHQKVQSVRFEICTVEEK